MGSKEIHLIVVPDLKAEGFLSMDLYAEDFRLALEQAEGKWPHLTWEFVDFPDERGQSKWQKAKRKFLDLPAAIAQRVQKADEEGKSPVVHILDHSYGNLVKARYPCVITCHDLANFKIRNWGSSANPLSRYLWESKVKNMKHARQIFAISQNTQVDIEQFIDIPTERVAVNYYGRDLYFSEEVDSSSHPVVAEMEQQAKGRKCLLHCGHNAERKNIRVMFQALAKLLETRQDVCLFKVGRKMEVDEPSLLELIEELGIQDSVIELGLQDKAGVRAAYRRADVFWFPSLYEGFGRPILEAQASKTPVVCADSSSLTEVAGKGALFGKADKPEQFAALLDGLLSDENKQQELVRLGLENILHFDWQKHLAQAVAVYEQIA